MNDSGHKTLELWGYDPGINMFIYVCPDCYNKFWTPRKTKEIVSDISRHLNHSEEECRISMIHSVLHS